MSWYTLILLSTWILGSGLVAYVGDTLGRRLGKKRLSLFGLRPRYTAIVFTVVTGMLIATATIVTIIFVDTGARRALFEAEQLYRQRSFLAELNRQLVSQQRHLKAQVSILQQQARTASLEAQQQRKSALQAHQEFLRAERDRQQAISRLIALHLEVRKLTQEIQTRQQRISSLSHRLRTLNDQLAESKRQQDLAHKELTLAQKALKDLEESVIQTRSALQASQGQLRMAREAEALAKRQRDATESQVRLLQKQVEATSQQLLSLRQQLAERQQELREIEEQLQRTQEHLRLAVAGIAFTRSGSLTFAAGEEIARCVIYQPETKEECLKALRRLLERASEIALRRGAAAPEGERAVRIVSFLLPTGGGGEVELSEEDHLRNWSQVIAEERKDVVVRAVSAVNSIQGEVVPIRLEVYVNRLIFPRGQYIAEALLDGKDPEPRLIEKVIALLQGPVRSAALERGLLPPPTGSVGEVTWIDILTAVRQLREMKRLTPVKVYAAADIWVSDPLLVRIKVG